MRPPDSLTVGDAALHNLHGHRRRGRSASLSPCMRSKVLTRVAVSYVVWLLGVVVRKTRTCRKQPRGPPATADSCAQRPLRALLGRGVRVRTLCMAAASHEAGKRRGEASPRRLGTNGGLCPAGRHSDSLCRRIGQPRGLRKRPAVYDVSEVGVVCIVVCHALAVPQYPGPQTQF